MKFITAIILASFMLLTFNPPVIAGSQPEIPQVQGEAAYLLDVQSGQVLFSKNPDERLDPASTTKIMTALLALERGNLLDVVTASPTMLNNKIVYGTEIYLTPGERIPLGELLYAVLLNSANDAAVAVAEHIGGNLTNFVQMMNERAVQIGMLNTHFANPTGLTESGHYTTAHDLALLAKVAYQNPFFVRYTGTKTHVIPRERTDVPSNMVNENKLLWQDSDVNGMKTGYTAQAGNCLVASATRNGRQLIGVILKSPGREMFSDMEKMLNYGFDQFSTTVYKPAGTPVTTLLLQQQSVNLILASPIYMTVKNGDQAAEFRLLPNVNVSGLQGVNANQPLGKVEVWQGNELLNTVSLVADRTVQPPPVKQSVNSFYNIYLALSVGLLSLLGIYLYIFKSQFGLGKRRSAQRQRRESNT